MKKVYLILFLFPLFALSQNRNQEFDSLRFYSQQLATLRKQAFDSLTASKTYKDALAGVERYKRKSNDYAGFVLFSGLVHSNLQEFNQNIAQEGFNAITSIAALYGLGISGKSGSTMFDFYFVSGSASKISKKGDEKISFSVTNALELDLGINLLKSRILSFYPFAGLSFRTTTLGYSKPIQLNSSFTNISDMVVNDQSVTLTSERLGYQAGLGFDVVLGENKKHTTNKVLFIKAGTNRPVWKDKYSFHGLTYDPQIKSGDWTISFGIKFGNKN